MLHGLIGEGSLVSRLKAGLDESARRVSQIAHRVANATTPGFRDFPALLEGGAPQGRSEVDLQAEMVALADEQLRYDATARLLRMNYDLIRTSVREG